MIINDELYRQVKEQARAEDRTVTSFVEDALRARLAGLGRGRSAPVDVYIAAAFHGDGPLPGVDLTSNAALADLMDEGVPIEKLR